MEDQLKNGCVSNVPYIKNIIRQLNHHCTKATTSSALVQTAAIKVSHDTLIHSATHDLPDTDAKPLYSKRQEI